jgi:hypothetical protein
LDGACTGFVSEGNGSSPRSGNNSNDIALGERGRIRVRPASAYSKAGGRNARHSVKSHSRARFDDHFKLSEDLHRVQRETVPASVAGRLRGFPSA